MRARPLLVLAVSAVLLLATGPVSAQTDPGDPDGPIVHHGSRSDPYGSFALSGDAAEKFQLPADMRLQYTSTYADGRTSSRYQQVYSGASVLGGQLTIIRSVAGTQLNVIGSRFAPISPANAIRISNADAHRVVVQKLGAHGDWQQELRLDPGTRSFFYEVRSVRHGSAPVRWVDAASGKIIRALDLRLDGDGIGVKGDTKQVATTRAGKNLYLLRTPDGRQTTYDDQNLRRDHHAVLMTDSNDKWNLLANWLSPDQRPGVDAQYYMGVVDRFYLDVFNRNSLDDAGVPLESHVHVDGEFCNAYWDGSAASFGDGYSVKFAKQAGRTCRPIPGALDVVAHEFTHGITQYTSELFAGPESVSLNEGFSDVMAASIEFYAGAQGLDPAAPADWLFGEDAVDVSSGTPGFRSLADPTVEGGLDHYSALPTTTAPHLRGGIAGHAFYLASQGGSNAGCTATATRPATHSLDCDVDVPSVGQTRATQIFYEGFTSLVETANFCDARNATVAVAEADSDAISQAWQAVGVAPDCAPTPPPAPPCQHPDVTVPFESSHPYADDTECIWTYDNGTPGFAFHFSLLDVEYDYDFVYVLDGDGNVLSGYTGNFGSDAPPTCIPTSVGSVVLVTDAFVTAAGFVVDSVTPC